MSGKEHQGAASNRGTRKELSSQPLHSARMFVDLTTIAETYTVR